MKQAPSPFAETLCFIGEVILWRSHPPTAGSQLPEILSLEF